MDRRQQRDLQLATRVDDARHARLVGDPEQSCRPIPLVEEEPFRRRPVDS